MREQHTDHLFLSFSFGGWKLLFDIKNKALSGTKTQTYYFMVTTGGRFNNIKKEKDAQVIKSSVEQ